MMNDFQNIKKSSLAILFLFITQSSVACVHNDFKLFDCDLCGCSTSGGSTGFGTLNNVSFVGLRYIYQNFESRDGIYNNSPKSKEQFNTYQIWGRVPINDSFYLNAMIPYQDLTRKFTNRTENINGFGDISIIGWYQLKLYRKGDNDVVDFNNEKVLSPHQFNIGLGIKLPTGAFEERLTDRINPGFQLGTGSLDGIFSLMHIYSKNRFGVNTAASYYFKSENKNEYQFGNQFSVASNAFYNIPFKSSALNPFLGMSADFYDSIKQYSEVLPDTDGALIQGTLGSEYMMGQLIFGANYSFPISQDLFGDNVKSKQRFTLYLNYSL